MFFPVLVVITIVVVVYSKLSSSTALQVLRPSHDQNTEQTFTQMPATATMLPVLQPNHSTGAFTFLVIIHQSLNTYNIRFNDRL